MQAKLNTFYGKIVLPDKFYCFLKIKLSYLQKIINFIHSISQFKRHRTMIRMNRVGKNGRSG